MCHLNKALTRLESLQLSTSCHPPDPHQVLKDILVYTKYYSYKDNGRFSTTDLFKPANGHDFVAWEYGATTVSRVNATTPIALKMRQTTVDYGDVRLWRLGPVLRGGWSVVGEPHKFVGVARQRYEVPCIRACIRTCERASVRPCVQHGLNPTWPRHGMPAVPPKQVSG